MLREESIDADQEDVQEREYAGSPGESEPSSGGRKRGGVMLYLLGLSVMGLGGALVFGPEYSWQVSKVADRVAGYGFSGAPLMIGGMLLFGMGMVARTRTSIELPPQVDKEADFLLVADQLATDLARMNSVLMQMQSELGAIEEAQRQLAAKRAAEEAEVAEKHNAMFRMAASLDKLTAHVSESLGHLDGDWRAQFGALSAQVGALSGAAPAPSPVPAPATPAAPAQPVASISMTPDPVQPDPQMSVEPGGPVSDAFMAPVDEPASALPTDLSPGELGDPSKEVFEAFDGLERGES